jgi:MoxR-like ATPase
VTNEAELLSPQQVSAAAELMATLTDRLNSVLLDQQAVVRHVVVAVVSRGHVLLEGLPGLGKTELCKGLARALALPFRRIQFTPDLLPQDVTGAYIFQGVGQDFVFRPGPLFASLVLADEINRSSPKTQSALLEAMQEQQVTVLGNTHSLPQPFFVLATQNPIELEGTYPLPEAQLDRFLFRIQVPGIGAKTMAKLLTEWVPDTAKDMPQVIDASQLQQLFDAVKRVHLPAAVAHYIARLVAATHAECVEAPTRIRQLVRFGASPRAALGLAGSARALALLKGKPNVGFDEVRELATAVLAHRLVLRHEATLENVTAAHLVAHLLTQVAEVARA